MEINGKVSAVMEPQSGVSQRTGNPWMSQEFVIDYFWWPNQTFPSKMVLRIFGEDRIKQWNVQMNDEVKIRYHIEATLSQQSNRWFNEVRCDGLEKVGASAPKPQDTPTDGTAQAQTDDQQQTQNNAPTGGENKEGGHGDDLPF
jgi:hypothetical protein